MSRSVTPDMDEMWSIDPIYYGLLVKSRVLCKNPVRNKSVDVGFLYRPPWSRRWGRPRRWTVRKPDCSWRQTL